MKVIPSIIIGIAILQIVEAGFNFKNPFKTKTPAATPVANNPTNGLNVKPANNVISPAKTNKFGGKDTGSVDLEPKKYEVPNPTLPTKPKVPNAYNATRGKDNLRRSESMPSLSPSVPSDVAPANTRANQGKNFMKNKVEPDFSALSGPRSESGQREKKNKKKKKKDMGEIEEEPIDKPKVQTENADHRTESVAARPEYGPTYIQPQPSYYPSPYHNTYQDTIYEMHNAANAVRSLGNDYSQYGNFNNLNMLKRNQMSGSGTSSFAGAKDALEGETTTGGSNLSNGEAPGKSKPRTRLSAKLMKQIYSYIYKKARKYHLKILRYPSKKQQSVR